MAPVWFIPMIAMFYVLSPLFQLIDRFPIFYLTIPLLLWVSYENPRHWTPWVSFVHFFPVYIIGMAASRYKDVVLSWSYKLRYVLVAAFSIAVAYQLLRTGTTQSYFNYLNKLFLSFLFISLLAHYQEKSFRFLTWFAAINFSVFFLHTYANAGLKILFTGVPAQSLPILGNVFYQAVYVAVLVAISIAVCLVVKKLTGKYSKYMIGA